MCIRDSSKIAGFTGTRCGYTIVPHELEREGMNLNKLWPVSYTHLDVYKRQSQYLGAIMVAAYSYMALVPIVPKELERDGMSLNKL